jgi:hypothetical protein
MLADSLLAKIEEQIEKTVDLIGLLPADAAGWRPPIEGAWQVGHLLGHLQDCLAGFCAVLYRAHPESLAHFEELRSLPVNDACGADEACRRIARYRGAIREGFALLEDADLARKLPTVFVPDGESVLTLLLGNLEHLINHKHQLFTYLQWMGVKVGTADLYRFRS